MAVTDACIRLLLVEDDFDVAASLATYLEPRGIDMTFAYSAREAAQMALALPLDVAVFDVQLPDGDGVALCADLKSRGLACPVVFLTARGSLEDKLRGFDAGGIDYVVKPFEPAELLARIRGIVSQVAPGGRAMTLQAAGYTLDVRTGTLRHGDASLALGATQLRIVRALMEAYPGTLARADLVDRLWEGEAPASDPLRMHIYHLRQALSAALGKPLIATVRGMGFRFDG